VGCGPAFRKIEAPALEAQGVKTTTKAQPKVSTWASGMRRAFDEGRLAEASALYNANKSTGATAEANLLRARILMNLDAPAAIGSLLKIRDARPAKEIVVQALALLGDAYARTGDFGAADHSLQEAFDLAGRVGDADLSAFVGYRSGRRFLAEGNPERARESLDLARAGRSVESRLNALHLESYILSREGRLREQARVLVEMLRSIDPALREHMEHRAWATHSLAALTRELYLPDMLSEVERQLGGAPWPEDFAVNRFQALKSLGWAKALLGDHLNAFRYLKRSAEEAPSKAWRVMAYCDRAYLARSADQEVWARHELAEAEDIADSTDWRSLVGEEPIALLLLSELFATVDAAKASVYLARFREMGDLKSPLSLLRSDPRLMAMVEYSSGVVESALGNSKRAMTLLDSAYRAYSRMGYEWRAGRCALAQFALKAEAGYLASARDKLRHYGASWLGQQMRELAVADSMSLPPMQMQVFRLLCEGRPTDEIAKTIGRSQFTVRNHVKALLKTFNVNSRPALLAEAMKRGLL
jgi:DNA-binding CsgD family transcriptional regulator